MSSDAPSDCAILVREAADWLITNPGGVSAQAQFQFFRELWGRSFGLTWPKMSLLQLRFASSPFPRCGCVWASVGEGHWRRADRILWLLQPSTSRHAASAGSHAQGPGTPPHFARPPHLGLGCQRQATAHRQWSENVLPCLLFFNLLRHLHRVTQSFHLYTVLAFNLITLSLLKYICIYVFVCLFSH